MRSLIVVIASLLFLGCEERYHGTKDICDGKYHVEFYSDWSDMGVCYLTDSVNFRIKVIRYNIDGEKFKFYCNPDSLIIELWNTYPSPKHILKTKTFNLKQLIEEGTLGDKTK